ncbi:immunoglobulin superfamily member 5 [Periophthalmus magnuspinnatus]|uniref:immunoglobulin superfamily member 5 n=1 Tax=Periophthalmus magnuspinnatus TaxID=409849 RepID=UPI00243634BD|nr:immunoglobulin superfamily member 5 [Periophthalmus magnuspinnatus]
MMFWKTWPYLLSSCLLLCTTGAVPDQFQLEPVNVTKLLGSEAQFKATVEGLWPMMFWQVGEITVLSISSSGEVINSFPQHSARLCGNGSSCVEFTIQNLTRQDSGPVTCTVQGDYGFKTSQLIVQESGNVSISGGDRTVKQEEQVEFQCEVIGWFPAATISWTLNGYAVNSSLVNTTDVPDGDKYNSTSVIKFQAVRNTTVTCVATIPALTGPISSSVQLAVIPKPTDWTVLIAIVVSFSSFALLVLLIFGVIFCYKRRKEKQPTYKEEIMRQRTQSQLSNTPQRQGQVNPVFTIDGQTSLPPSEHDSGFYQSNGLTLHEPTSLESTHAGNGFNAAYANLEVGFPKKHRHVTIV